MLFEVKKEKLNEIENLFNQIRFFMGNSVLDGVMGKAYVDNIEKPKIAFLVVRSYCFISGNMSKNLLRKVIDKYFKDYKLIPSDSIAIKIEEIYNNDLEKFERYSLKKDVTFNEDKLNYMINNLDNKFRVLQIDEDIANDIKKTKFINITDDYKNNGIGFYCAYNNEVIGVASSNIFYKNGIEVNIKVKEEYRRNGIAQAMAAKLILECLNRNKKISWDAANINSLKLAQKLGFEYDSTYNIYMFKKKAKMKDLVIEIEKIIEDSNKDVSILIKKLDSNDKIFDMNCDLKLVSASTIKIPIMLSVLEEVKNNNVNMDDTIFVSKYDILNDTEVFENGEKYYSINELINWMIIKSDNTATNVLLKYFGIENINYYIRNTLNLKSTYLERYMLDKKAIENGLNNYMSQKDMLNIFTLLFNKKILNHELCNIAINILYNQRHYDQIMRYIYEPVKFAHKTGSLSCVNHDVGIMNINDNMFYIGISVYNSKEEKENKKLIGKVGKKIYDYLKKI